MPTSDHSIVWMSEPKLNKQPELDHFHPPSTFHLIQQLIHYTNCNLCIVNWDKRGIILAIEYLWLGIIVCIAIEYLW